MSQIQMLQFSCPKHIERISFKNNKLLCFRKLLPLSHIWSCVCLWLTCQNSEKVKKFEWEIFPTSKHSKLCFEQNISFHYNQNEIWKFRTKGWDANNSNFMNLEVTNNGGESFLPNQSNYFLSFPVTLQICPHSCKI